jgi:hypothetical protein
MMDSNRIGVTNYIVVVLVHSWRIMDKPHCLGELPEPPCCCLGGRLTLRKILGLDGVQSLSTQSTPREMSCYTIHAEDNFLYPLGVQKYVRT